MKKTLAASLALMTVLLSCAGCRSTAKPHITIATSETEEVPADPEPVLTEPSVTEITPDDVPDQTDVTYPSEEDDTPSVFPTGFIANGDIWVDISTAEHDSYTSVFYVPKLRDDSGDAYDINSEISDLIAGCMQEEDCTGSDYIYFSNGEDVFSFLILIHYSSGADRYKCVTYNREGSVRLSGEDIMEYVGIDPDSLYATAAAAVRKVIGEENFADGELIADSVLGQATASSEEMSNAYQVTFAAGTLSSEMPMFINEHGEICFCSDIVSLTGDASYKEAYSASGFAYRGAVNNSICGSASMLDINSDGIKEYIESSDQGAVIYRITGDSKEELVSVSTTSLLMTSAYFFEESGFESRPILRADLGSSEGSASYEMINVSSDYSEINSFTITWSDSNADGAISEEDSFLINGELSSYSEWYDLTGIS